MKQTTEANGSKSKLSTLDIESIMGENDGVEDGLLYLANYMDTVCLSYDIDNKGWRLSCDKWIENEFYVRAYVRSNIYDLVRTAILEYISEIS